MQTFLIVSSFIVVPFATEMECVSLKFAIRNHEVLKLVLWIFI